MANDFQHELKQFKINIKGHQFSVSSKYSEERIRRVEAFLSEKIDEVAANSDSFNLMSLTVLTALNLADELLNIQRNREYMSESARESLVSICQQLDNIIEKKIDESILSPFCKLPSEIRGNLKERLCYIHKKQ